MECYNYTITKDVYTNVKTVKVCPDPSSDPCSDEEWIRECSRRTLGYDHPSIIGLSVDIFCEHFAKTDPRCNAIT